MPLTFLHVGHEVRNSFNGLEIVSWAVAGLAIGAVVLLWGRLIAWLRTPDREALRILRWGADEAGCYFEVSRGGTDGTWSLEGPDGALVPLDASEDGLLRTAALTGEPRALVSSDGARLPL